MKKLILVLLALALNLSAYAAEKDKLLALSDKALFEKGLKGGVGKCSIADTTKCETCHCDYYVKTSKTGLEGAGLPHGLGTGCLVHAKGKRAMNICWPLPNYYQAYEMSKTPVCTDNHVKNAANMLRIGIKRGLCDVEKEEKALAPTEVLD